MKCPHDNTTLVIAERAGIEIDYCPLCRGVWLDRGELDKLIDRSLDVIPAAPPPMDARDPREAHHAPPAYDPRPAPPPPRDYGGARYDSRDRYADDGRYRQDDRYRDDDRYRKRRRKESFLGEIFDIFD